MAKYLAAAGVAVFVASYLALHILNHNFDFIRNTLSQMIYASWGWLVTIAFIGFGFGTVSEAMRQEGATRYILCLLAVCLFTIAMAEGAPLGENLHGVYLVHDIANRLLSCLIPLGCLAAYLRTRSIANAIEGVVGLALVVIFLFGLASNWGGLLGRMVAANGVVWFSGLVIARHLT